MTASALEQHLDALESKVEELLSVFEKDDKDDTSQHEKTTPDQDVDQHQDELTHEERCG